MKPLYEVFDEFEQAKTKKDRMSVIGNNLSQTLHDVLKLTFHPDCQWKVNELPENYRIPNDVLPGITFDSLHHQMRKLYLYNRSLHRT